MKIGNCVIALLMILVAGVMAQGGGGATEQQLQTIRNQFKELMADLNAPMVQFEQRYEEELKKLEAKAQGAGNLGLVVEVRNEITGFRGRSGEIEFSKNSDLARLQGIYKSEVERISSEMKGRGASLVHGYMAKLEEFRVSLTKEGEIDLALSVQGELTSLKEKWSDTAEPVAVDPGSPSRIPKKVTYRNGMVVAEYPMVESQVAEQRGPVSYKDLIKLKAEWQRGTIDSLYEWSWSADKNGVAIGYLKIETPGEYLFNSNSFYDRNALYIGDEDTPLCPYGDGEQKTHTITLEEGMVRIISIGFVSSRGNCKVSWKPPGQTELTPIPENLLFHAYEDIGR